MLGFLLSTHHFGVLRLQEERGGAEEGDRQSSKNREENRRRQEVRTGEETVGKFKKWAFVSACVCF